MTDSTQVVFHFKNYFGFFKMSGAPEVLLNKKALHKFIIGISLFAIIPLGGFILQAEDTLFLKYLYSFVSSTFGRYSMKTATLLLSTISF